MPIATLQPSAPLHASRQEAVAFTLRQIHLEGDRIVRFFIAIHCGIALCLARFYDTWTLALGVGGLAAGLFLAGAYLLPGSYFTRCLAGVSLQTFTALHIYQLHGMAEMHFFFFTAFTVLLVYRDWKSLWPGALLIIGQHIAFAYLHNIGSDIYFFTDPYIDFTKLFFHFGIALGHVAICGYWAARLKRQSIFETNAQYELSQLMRETQEKSELIGRVAEELEAKNEALSLTNVRLDASLQTEKGMRQQLNQKMGELAQAQSQLVHAEKMASLGQLTAGIAHEINNPINFVFAGINALEKNLAHLFRVVDCYEDMEREGPSETGLRKVSQLKEEVGYEELRGELCELVGSIKKGATRTSEIVRGLRNFARTDGEERKPANLHEGINSTLLILQSSLADRVTVVKQYDANLPPIECHPGQLNQVFMNILCNAQQAIEGPGTITITTRERPDGVELCFADTGRGMSPEVKRRIFEPFFTTKEVGKGTGLGLSITYGIIQKHGGTITVESSPGAGATFRITLPKGS
jgi:signal transduction histidine kinase